MWVEKVGDKYRFYERYIDHKGKRRRVSITSDKNTAQVRNKVSALLQKKIEDKLLVVESVSNVTVDQVAAHWFEIHSLKVKNKTAITYEVAMRSILDRFSGIPLKDISSASFNRYLLEISENGQKSHWYLKQRRLVFKMIANHAITYFNVDISDVLPKLKLPACKPSKDITHKFLEREELELLIDKLESFKPIYANMVRLQVSTGVRIGELLAIDYKEDIDFEEGHITIQKSFDKSNQTFVPTKTNQERVVYINTDTISIIKETIEMQSHIPSKCGRNILFKNRKGYPIDVAVYNNVLMKYPVNGKVVSSHFLRHTFITLAIEAGIPKDFIARQVGHSDTKMIDKVYSHISKGIEENQKRAFQGFKI